MIEFEMPKPIAKQRYFLQTVAEEMMRPHSRYFDEHEHEIPWDYIKVVDKEKLLDDVRTYIGIFSIGLGIFIFLGRSNHHGT